MMEKGPLARRARSTKRREGKAYSLICFSPEGKYLKDLMWIGTEIWAFSKRNYSISVTQLILEYLTCSSKWKSFSAFFELLNMFW